ncbi:MAG TPA: glycosyltransferase [Lacunisphaera sp.]
MQSISIVLCTFNGDRFLDAQIKSLREQEGVAEIVVVDDASMDGTLSIIQSHAVQDSRIRLFRNSGSLGVAQNFERAIGLATCPWIALSDQDDVWLPEKISRLRKAWDGKSCLMHHATHKFRGTVPDSLPFPARQRRKFSGSDLRRLLYRNSVVGHTTLVRADVVRRLMPFPADLPYDWWIGAGTATLGEVQYVDEYLVHYRIHDRNAYHPGGSRLKRLRSEHGFRVGIMEALLELGTLPVSQLLFVEDYLHLLGRSQKGFCLVLWRFYLTHAALFFGGVGTRISRFTAVRKSFGATLASTFKIFGEDVPTAPAMRSLPSRIMVDKPLEKVG